ncbi:MAG: leucine-rich repeat protein, partial [Muribaculaceae bacterium]|nr:leucine-rich repeat protein [Muribaculaceae bacterium]
MRSICSGAFSGCSGLTSINIPDGVTSIENSTFSYCSALTSINIPDGVTSIGSSAFWGCSALTSISIPDGVTSIGDGAFVDCNSLTSVTIPDGVTSIDFDAFLRCSSLISINIPDGVTSIGSAAFSGCSGLNSINIPDGVTSIGSSAFSECSSLTSINIPDGVTSIEYSTFSGCSSLTSINIPDGVTSIGIIAFSGCSNLTELTLPESLTSIGESAFSNCRNLTSINIPAGLISIDDSAFSLCNPNVSITYSAEIPITVEDSAFDASVYRSGTLNMPNATLADIQATVPWNKFQHIQAKDGSIGFGLAAGEDFEYEGIWYTVIDSEVKTVKTKDGYYDSGSDAYIPGNKCEGEVTIPATVSDGTSDYSVEEIGNLSFYDCSSLTAINIPAGVKSIGLRTFYGCSSLTSINIPEGMTSIGDHAFENCTSLTSIEIPAGVISIGISAFYECSSLTSIDIPASVTSIGEQAFFNCSGLTSINIPDGITTIGPWTFCGCSGLTSIIIPESVTIIEGSAFSGCSCLSSINIPDAVTYIDVSLFKGCISLTSISIPDKVTSIGEYAFSGCSGLTSIVIPDGVTYIGHDAFEGCSNLTSINIPDGVTLIGSDAFSGCSALTSINIPGGVELQRSQRIFSGCSGLTSIKYDAAIPVSTFENNFNDYIQPTLYMPNATLADIQATVPWNKFQHIQAKDGSIGLSLSAGDDFIYDNIAYTVIDAEAKTVKTKEGSYLGEYDEDITPGNGWNGELTIPSTVTDGIDNYSVVEIGFCSFYQNDFLTSVTLPESLRTIEMSAFQACSNLTTVNLNDSLETIKPGAFVDCGKLQSISLPASLTSIEGRPFNGCDMMSEVTYKASSPIEGNENLFSNTVYTTATLNMPNATLESVQAISPWNKFLRITASDGSVAPAGEGEDFEYDGITYTVIDVENRTCRTKIKYFNSPDSKVSGDLDIPAIVSDGVYDYTVVEIGRSSFRGAAITSLTLPESITNIGENAFSGCDSLKTVNLPASMPSVEYGVFGECRNIRKVNYAAASPVTAAENLFDVAAYCMAILSTPNATLADVEASVPWNKFRRIEASDGSLNVPLADGADFEYEGLWYTVLDVNNNTVKTKNGYTSDGSYFSYNKAEGDLVIPAEVFYENQKYTVEAVGDMGFLTQTRITSVVFPNTLKTIGLMAFKYCADLNSITFPESLTKIDADAFSFCTKLEEIVLPDNLTVIERSDFSGCTALTSVKLPNSLTRIGDGAFHSCKNLTSVSFPSSLKKIGAHAFNTCNSLTSITLPDSLTSIVEYAFEKCINLTKIYLPASIEYMDYYIFRGCDNISDVTYEAVHPVTAISSFSDIVYENATLNMPNAYLSEIETVEPWNLFKNVIAREGGLVEGEEFEYEGIWYTVIDSEAKTVKTRDGQDGDNPGNHFEGALTIPATVSYDNSDYTVVEIGHHGFCSLSGLTSVAMPATVVKLGEAAFNNCENLASVELPDSLSEVEGFVFDTCVALASIKLPEGLEYVGERMFAHCHSLTSATLPSTIKEIRGWAFGDANLSSIDLPEGLETIGGEAFAGNKNITSISFPDNVTAIWDRAFSGCGLTSLILPESLQSLGDGAFYHNYELESIVLPASITSIGLDAFGEGDDKLDSVTYNAEEPIEANSGIFGFTGELYDRATLTMPNATLAAIQAVTPWNLFKRINANDGSIAPALPSGEDFVYNGITYTVIDSEAKTVKTQDRWYVESKDVISNEMFTSDLEIPSTVTFDGNEYTVVEIGNSSFFSCSPLTAIKLPSTLKTIGEYAFDTSNLTSIIVPEGVDSIKLCAFRFCDRLTTVHLPSTLRSIGGEAFKEAKKLSSINFPEGLVSIEHGAFYVCEALTEVHLPASLVSIGNEAFGADSNLTVLEFKEGLKVIGTSAFWGTGITSVTLPASLTDIGDMAFSCYFINEVNYNATIPIEAPEDLFYSAKTNIYETATLNMPNATLESVQATMPWKKFLRITASDGMVVPFASEITLNRDTVELKVGESLSLEATVKPDYATDKTVTWTSDNEDVATVDAEGKVTAIALGEATITATSGEVTATCKVTVVPTPVESITLSVDTLNLKKGETATLTATIAPEDVTDKTVAWTSDNEEVATVDAEGKVTAIALGEATITAASGEVTATCKVT